MTKTALTTASTGALAHLDRRSFFERTLSFGVDHALLGRAEIDRIKESGAKGMVQIANYFGSAHVRRELDDAMQRMVYLVSLALESQSAGNLQVATQILAKQSFLALSKAGSDMLRQLQQKGASEHAQSVVGAGANDQEVKDFLRHYSLKNQLTLRGYLQRMQLHDEQLLYCDCALWLGRVMLLETDLIEENDAASVIRACLFSRALGKVGGSGKDSRMQGPVVSSQEFLQAIKSMQKQGLAKTLKCWSPKLYADVPPQYQAIVKELYNDVVKRDLVRIITGHETGESLNQLLDYLAALYFRRPIDLNDISGHDGLVSEDWQNLSQGRSDDDSMATLLLCVASHQKPQVAVAVTTAKAIVKALRRDGVDEAALDQFIEERAPVSMQNDLKKMWAEDMLPGLRTYVLIEADSAMERALAFLHENCCVKATKTVKNQKESS